MAQVLSSPVHSADATDAERVERWLAKFEQALHNSDRASLEAAFADDCHWRDLLAFTWTITPHVGLKKVVDGLVATQSRVQARSFQSAKGRTAPRRLKRAGVEVIEAIFSFETATGRGHGLLRLLAAQPEKAWVFSTSLGELKGYEEPTYERRATGNAYSRDAGDNWAARRAKEQAFADREPVVLIIGAGQSGLSTAARLRMLGIEALCVDKNARVGDNWRLRYDSLALHNQVSLNHMAYMPFPPHWPKYLPKDMLGTFLEHYAAVMECNVWMETAFVSGEYDDAAGHWNARVRRADGSERVLKPKHILFANGIVGRPNRPKLPGLEDFKGTVMHSHDFREGAAWAGKNALVLGVGNSGHDIAQDLQSRGANVKLIQRGSITVFSVKAAGLQHTVYYDEGLPTEDSDLIAMAATYPMAVRNAQMATQRMLEIDKDLLAGLKAKGFKLDIGEDGTGYMLEVRRIHSGYYLNCGASELIVDGKIGLLQYEDIDRFVADGALMKDGRVEKADLLVTATGYQNQQVVVRDLLGDEVADKVGPVWGLDAEGELKNMYKPTAQKGLWFIGSGLQQARIWSRVIALQIKAREVGLIS